MDFNGPSMKPHNEEFANNNDDNFMDAAPTDELLPQQLHRIFKYHISTNGTGPGSSIGMVIFNTDEPTLNYYENLYRIHSLIDEKHDNTDGKRVSEYLKNKVYKDNVIDAINYSTVGRVSSFSTGVTVSTLRNYSVNNTVTTLHDALERLGDSFIIGINGNQYTAPTLPSLQILPWNCFRTIIQDELANNMVVYKGFDTINGCTNENAGDRVNKEMGIQSTGYVHDVGPIELFNRITANGPIPRADGQRRNIVSGKLDSSPVSGEFTNPGETQIENLQTLIPFMDIYNGAGELIGIIMIYIAPRLRDDDDDDDYDVFLAFKFFRITTGNYARIYDIDEIKTILGKTRTQNIVSIENTGWFTYLVEDAVPNLPEIAQYMSGANGCFPAILKKMFGLSSKIYNKCEPYEAIGIRLFGTIGNSTIFQTRQDLFIMAFLMKIKWIGDLSRLIDSFMITEVHYLPTATATVDGFMKRFACLSNLYVYCANKNGGDLTINDVKTLTPQQIAILDERRQQQQQEQDQRQQQASNDAMQDKIYKIITKMKWYKDLITRLNQFVNNNWIPRQVILILNGILGEGAVEMEKLRFSSRIISTVVSCLGKQTFMYEKVKFTYTEMQSILDYFLTLFYYHIVFDYFKSSPFTKYENDGNIFVFVLTQSSAMSIGITNRQDNVDIEYFFTRQNPENQRNELYHKNDIDISKINNGNPGGFISYYENIFNDIDNTMNILEKYNNISKIIPQYTGVNSRHRTLFDDSLYLLSKNIAEINTAKPVVQQLMSQTITISQIPELSYEPNVGNTIRTHFGIFIDNQDIFPQQGGMPTPPMNTNTTAKYRIQIPKNPIKNTNNKTMNVKHLLPLQKKKKNVEKKNILKIKKILFPPNKTIKKINKNISQDYDEYIYENFDTNNIINQSEYKLFEGYSNDENIAIEQLKLETGYIELLPMHEPYYSDRIVNINSYRQGILNDLHMLNENFTDGNNDQQINELSQYSDSETNFIFDLLYQTINYPYDEKKIDIIYIKPTSYQYTTRFFGNNFTIFYKLAFDQIKADINFLEPNNQDKIDIIVTRFENYTKYLHAYRDLKKDINTINSVYTDIYIEEYIEKTYSDGTIHNFDNGRQSFDTNDFDTNDFYTNGFYTILIPCYRILTPPTLIPPKFYNNNIPPSVFNLPGGNSKKKHRKIKKKTSKLNKKNTRKNRRHNKHRKTKRKPSK